MRLIHALFLSVASLVAGASFVHAQQPTAGDLERLHQEQCTPANLAAIPGMKSMCDMNAENLRKLKQQPSEAPKSAASDPKDGSSVCDCKRALGRCSASARILSREVSKLTTGLSSLVVVRVQPPHGQCVEVTAFLEEAATYSTNVNRTGHPLYSVMTGATDIEWRNVGTSASKLEYRILAADTECFVCAPKGGAGTPGRAATQADNEAASRAEVREAMEKQYRDCVAGVGPLMQSLSEAQRRPICQTMRQQIDQQPR